MVAVTETIGYSECSIEDRNEPITELTYLVCFECGHVYETTQDMYKAIKELADQMEIIVPPESEYDFEAVTYCPLCLHDFPPI